MKRQTQGIIGLRGRNVRYSVRPGAGVPLVLCNGIGSSMGLLQPFVDALDPSIPVVRFDVPGVGGSEVARMPYRFWSMARLVGDLLDALGFDEVDMLGISWGGGLAQQFAFQNPARCRRLVLVSTATGALMVPGSPRVLSKMATPRRHRDPAYAARVAGTIYGGQMRTEPERARRALHSDTKTVSRAGYAMQLFAGFGWSSLPWLPLIRQRTLIVAGDDDPIIPLANAHIMDRLMPRSELHVFSDGHLGLVTRAGEIAPRVARFLRD